MHRSRSLSRFERTLAAWLEELSALPSEAYARTPPAGGWSAGQVTDHVVRAGELILDQVDKCARGEAEDVGFRFKGAVACAIGTIPPVRIRVPKVKELEPIASPESLSKGEALEQLEALAARTRKTEGAANQASPRQKTPHPLAGPLSAAQWYQFHEMHLRHHLRQLRRTAASVAPRG